jgi:hypothetical protein
VLVGVGVRVWDVSDSVVSLVSVVEVLLCGIANNVQARVLASALEIMSIVLQQNRQPKVVPRQFRSKSTEQLESASQFAFALLNDPVHAEQCSFQALLPTRGPSTYAAKRLDECGSIHLDGDGDAVVSVWRGVVIGFVWEVAVVVWASFAVSAIVMASLFVGRMLPKSTA